MNNKFINSSKKLEIEDIEKIEDYLGIKLPKDLKDLYLKSNGGELDDEKCVFLDDDENDYSVKTFLPIKYKRTEGDQLLESSTHFFVKKKKLISDKFIVFAIDWGGFPYCLDTISNKIYFANIENEDIEDRMILISNTLDEFINGMKTEEEAY